MAPPGVGHSPMLVLRRDGTGWAATGAVRVRLGNQNGETALPHLPSAGWTYENGCLTATADRHGFVPLFYYDGPKGFGVAGSWVDLQQHFELSRFDDAAIACYLRLGHYLAEDTPFEGVRRLAPAGRLIWADGTYRIDEPAVAVPSCSRIDRNSAVVEYGRRLRDAVADIVQSSRLAPISLISGGQDSRHILLAMLESGTRPSRCLTQVPASRGEQDDSTIARRLCDALDVNMEAIDAAPRSLRSERRKNRLVGMESAYHAWLLPLADALRSVPRGLIFDGLGGDALSASRFLTPEWIRAIRTDRVADAAAAYMGPEGHLQAMLRPEYLERWPRALAHERVTMELRRWLGHPNPQATFQIRNRTRRAIAVSLWPLLARGHDVALPYFHPEVFDFLIALPMDLLIGRKFHREAIAVRYPEFRNLPYAVGGNRMPEFETWRFSRIVVEGFALSRRKTIATMLRSSYLQVRLARAAVQRMYVEELDGRLNVACYLDQLVGLTRSKRHCDDSTLAAAAP